MMSRDVGKDLREEGRKEAMEIVRAGILEKKAQLG